MALTPDEPLPGELGVEGAQAHLGLRAGLQLGNGTEDATPGAGLGQRLLRDDSLVTPESLSGPGRGEQQLLIFHRVTQTRGEARQSPDSLSARRPPEGRGDLWALHVGPSAPAGFGRVHRALRFALLLLKLCQSQLVAGTCPETV